jgi:CubicO group peptidase (beta-lactamase class C family)
MTRGHVDSLYGRPGSVFGLGFQVLHDPGRAAQFGSAGTFSWGGAYGSEYWVDPADELVAVFLIQEVPRGDLDLADRFRALVYQAIVADAARQRGAP